MKYDKRIIQLINDTFYVPEILERERGDTIHGYDANHSCVAHMDVKPSMRVFVGKGKHAYCYTCGKTYTPYLILKLIKGFNYFQTVQYFIDHYGFKIPEVLKDDINGLDNKKVAENVMAIKRIRSDKKALTMLSKTLYLDFRKGTEEYTEYFLKKVQKGVNKG